jgi:hypothetical protein
MATLAAFLMTTVDGFHEGPDVDRFDSGNVLLTYDLAPVRP